MRFALAATVLAFVTVAVALPTGLGRAGIRAITSITTTDNGTRRGQAWRGYLLLGPVLPQRPADRSRPGVGRRRGVSLIEDLRPLGCNRAGQKYHSISPLIALPRTQCNQCGASQIAR